jgi:hypothetical protein
MTKRGIEAPALAADRPYHAATSPQVKPFKVAKSLLCVIASAAKQSRRPPLFACLLDCFVAALLAMTKRGIEALALVADRPYHVAAPPQVKPFKAAASLCHCAYAPKGPARSLNRTFSVLRLDCFVAYAPRNDEEGH